MLFSNITSHYLHVCINKQAFHIKECKQFYVQKNVQKNVQKKKCTDVILTI
jgi:hypothetical protein